MFRIDVSAIKGHKVVLAPYGTEGEAEPCLIWRDPNPLAMIKVCKVQNASGNVLTAKTERGLMSIARRRGLLVDCNDLYVP